jgi:hypothetical protein
MIKHYQHKWLPYGLDISSKNTAVLYEFTPKNKQRLWSVSGKTLAKVLVPVNLEFKDFVEIANPLT